MIAAPGGGPTGARELSSSGVPETLVGELLARATEDPHDVALLRKRHGVWEVTTWTELNARVQQLAGALRERGLRVGGNVVIIADATPEWLTLDLAVQSLGAVSIALYPGQSRSDIRNLLDRTAIDVLAGGDDEQLGRARDCLPDARRHLLLDARSLRRASEPDVELLSALMTSSESAPILELDPGSGAIGLVSAGTSGSPRLMQMSQGQIVTAARRAAEWLRLARSDRNLCHAPCALPAARLLDLYAPICAGSTIAFPESPQTVVENLVELQPSVVTTPPRALELLAAEVELRIGRAGRVKGAANRWARRQRERASSRSGDEQGSPRPTLTHYLVDRQIVSKLGLRRARRVVCVGAPIAPELLRFYWSLGVPLVEAYGQVETFGLAFVQRGPRDNGTAGLPFPGVQARIVEGTLRLGVVQDGREIWIHTEDVAALDGEGRLVLAGGRSEIEIGVGGSEIVLSRIEGRLRLSPFVNEAVAVRADLGGANALIQFEFDAVRTWLSHIGHAVSSYDVLARDPEVIALVGAAVESANRDLSDAERIVAFRLLERPLSIEEGEVSPNQRVRRTVVRRSFAEKLAEMSSSSRSQAV